MSGESPYSKHKSYTKEDCDAKYQKCMNMQDDKDKQDCMNNYNKYCPNDQKDKSMSYHQSQQAKLPPTFTDMRSGY